MISFELSPEETELQRSTRRYATEQVRPLARRCEEEGDVASILADAFRNLGLAQLGYPESWGGIELGMSAVVVVEEELAWGDAGVATGMPRAGTCAAVLGSLPELTPGSAIGSPLRDNRCRFAVLAPTIVSGSRDDSGALSLTGTIVAPAIDRADAVLIPCRLEQEMILVWLTLPATGVTVSVESHQLGLRAAPVGRLRLAVSLSSPELIVARGVRAHTGLQLGLQRELLLIAARCVGTARAAFDYAARYATQRATFARAIADHQAIAFMVADMGIRVDAARALLWNAAWAMDAKNPQEVDRGEILLAAATFAAEHVVAVASDAVQILGGHGYIQDHPVEKWMRDARTLANHSASITDNLSELSTFSA